ncbi:hypothetical protein BLOT_012824 [Blomia tropicalis]|nr:hypothetical protein BLOT_012824 [Blomia tropicalis]
MINWNKNSINGNSNNISSSSFDTRTYEKDIEHQFQLQIPTHDFNLEELSQLIIDYLTKNQRFMRKNDHNNNPNRKGIHRFPTMTIASSSANLYDTGIIQLPTLTTQHQPADHLLLLVIIIETVKDILEQWTVNYQVFMIYFV